jgi:hypothetical protein
MDPKAVEHEIRSLEGRRYQAMIDGDADTLEQLLGDGLVYTHSTGTSDGKAAYLEAVRAYLEAVRTALISLITNERPTAMFMGVPIRGLNVADRIRLARYYAYRGKCHCAYSR